MARRVRVSTLGEAMLRLSVPAGERLTEAPSYRVHVAGSELNVAYALARVGLAAAWSSVLPRNRLAERVAGTLRAAGVDVAGIVWAEAGRLGLYFVEPATEPRPTSVVYDRAGSAFAGAGPALFDWDLICDADVVHLSGITFGLSPTAFELGRMAVAEARRRGCRLSFDVNHRALLWTADAAAAALRELRGSFDLVVCKAEDARELFGLAGEPEAVVCELQGLLGAGAAALTLGGEGAIVAEGGRVVRRPAFAVLPVDRIGAGDAFMAGLLWGWCDGSLEAGLERGVAMSALKMTLQGDLFTLDGGDVERLLAGHRREIDR